MSIPRPALAAAAALLSTGAFADDPHAGTRLSLSVGYYSLICGTCPIDSGSVLEVDRGGPGQAQTVDAEAGSGWQLGGRAAIDTGGLPDLGASAAAGIVVDESIPKTFFYSATVFATGTQRYDYAGLAPTDYTIGYTLDGTFTLAASDSASLMTADGGLSVYAGDYNPGGGEVPGTLLGTSFSYAQAELAGTHAFNEAGSVTFTLNPGDAFYVWAALIVTANSSHQVPGSVDAMHTLALAFTAGDTSLLTPALAPVPEPPAVALVTLGLTALGWWARRPARRRANF